MAISLIQANAVNQGATSTVVIPISASGSGNILIVLTAVEAASAGSHASVTSITDNASNTYSFVPGTADFGGISNSLSSEIWYAPNSKSGATSITVNFDRNLILNDGIVYVAEFSGVATSSPVDVGAIRGGTGGSSMPGPILTTTNATDLLISILCPQGAFATSVNSPWIGINFSGTTNLCYLVTSTTGTFNCVYNATPVSSYSSSAAAFKAQTILTLSLSDSVTSSDSVTNALSNIITLNVSDSMTLSDTFPQSFSIESDALVVPSGLVVETLVNQLIPAHVKTYYQIEE